MFTTLTINYHVSVKHNFSIRSTLTYKTIRNENVLQSIIMLVPVSFKITFVYFLDIHSHHSHCKIGVSMYYTGSNNCHTKMYYK